MKEYNLGDLDSQCEELVDSYNHRDDTEAVILPPEVNEQQKGEITTNTTPEVKPVQSGTSLFRKNK